jgi:hypothetical protein
LNDLQVRLGRGEIDSQSALELGSLTKHWIDSKRAGEDHQLKITVQGGGKEQVIHITGGMDPLPGTAVIMPQLNGRKGPSLELEATPALTESTPKSHDRR